MKQSRSLLVGYIGCSLFLPSFVHAASLYIDPAQPEIFRGDSVTLAVRLDVDENNHECVNTVDAVINYPGNIDPVDVSIGDSILRVWVEEPTIDHDKRTITFAGGIPNGYCGRIVGDPRLTNVLAEIVFRSPGFTVGGDVGDDNTAEVSFAEETAAYLNDGLGTKASLSTYPATITLNDSPGSKLSNNWKDRVSSDSLPPEEFSISLQKDEHAFAKEYYIAFNTTDKQTGVDHYEVMEEPLTQFGSFQWGRADAPWIEARSPYVLKDQSLNSIIRVRAIDKAGNEYIATYVPDGSMRTISRDQVLTYAAVAGGIVIIIVLVLLTVLYRKHRRKQLSDHIKTPTE